MDNYIEYEVHVTPIQLTQPTANEDERFYSVVYRCGENRDYAFDKFKELEEEFDKKSNEVVIYDVSLLEKTVNYSTIRHVSAPKNNKIIHVELKGYPICGELTEDGLVAKIPVKDIIWEDCNCGYITLE